jgi:hypothetical protein
MSERNDLPEYSDGERGHGESARDEPENLTTRYRRPVAVGGVSTRCKATHHSPDRAATGLVQAERRHELVHTYEAPSSA